MRLQYIGGGMNRMMGISWAVTVNGRRFPVLETFFCSQSGASLSGQTPDLLNGKEPTLGRENLR